MILIFGKLIDIAPGESTNPKTGEITKTLSAEVLHKEKGKSVITSLKFDPSVIDQWTKAISQEISVEIRAWNMRTEDGGSMAGYCLADKKSIPTVVRIPQSAKS